MTTTTRSKDPVVVIIQLTGGNDYMNSVVPYADGHYNDARNGELCIGEDQVLKIDDHFGLHPTMAPLKELYDDGEMALIHGVGYPNSPRSALPLDGHLAHLRTQQGRHRGLGWPRDPRPRPDRPRTRSRASTSARACPARWSCPA